MISPNYFSTNARAFQHGIFPISISDFHFERFRDKFRLAG